MTGRRLSLPAVLMAVMALALLVAFGVGQATAAPAMTDGPTFLARYGLDASSQPPVRIVDRIPGAYAEQFGTAYDQQAQAGFDELLLDLEPNDVAVGSRVTAHTMLHESLHYASFWHWVWDFTGVDAPRELPAEAWMIRYEEGLVDATADALFPNWWRYLTGRRLDPDWRVTGSLYEPASRWWKALAKKATGESWRSRAGREWLVAAITLAPSEREALAATVNAA